MEMFKRIELIETLIKVSELDHTQPGNPGKEKLGKCIWTDLDGNRRCNDFWTRVQSDQVRGTFYPYSYEGIN